MDPEIRFEDYFAKVPARRIDAPRARRARAARAPSIDAARDRRRAHGPWRVALAMVAMIALASACTTSARPPAPTSPPPVSAASSPLSGTWLLVAADDLQPDGRRTPAYGSAPSGLLMIDDDGRYSLQIFRADRPAFAAGVKSRGTPAEFEAAVLGMSSHIGHCAIDPTSNTIDFHIESSSFPNWNGTEQKRRFTLTGDELSYQVPASAAGTAAVPISVWRRIRRPAQNRADSATPTPW